VGKRKGFINILIIFCTLVATLLSQINTEKQFMATASTAPVRDKHRIKIMDSIRGVALLVNNDEYPLFW
jgi:hypothetical protein